MGVQVHDYRSVPKGIQRSTPLERVIFGRPAPEAIAHEVEALGKTRVFLLSSNSLSGPDALPAQIAKVLGPKCVGVFTDIPSHAPRTAVVAGAAAARAAGADILVSVGGGSVSDATKHMLLCLWEGITQEDQLDRFLLELRRPADPTRRPADAAEKVRMLAVPTMLSAGEFTWFAGVTDTDRRVKDVAFHPLFSPISVVLDPAVTLPIPIPLLHSTGMKAVEHAVEFLCSPTQLPFVDAVAGQALRLLCDNLPRLGGPDDDLKLRMNLQLASWYSIYPIACGVGAGGSHAIGHVLGPLGVAHGDTTGVVLPAVLRWNEPVNAAIQEKAAVLAGRPGARLADLVANLARSLGLPTTLAEVGIRPDQADEIADKAMDDPLIRANPRPIRSREDILEILELAW